MTLRESRVVLVEARSGQSRVLSTRQTPESYGMLEPSWSPDGSRLTLLGASDAEPGRHQVVDVDVQTGLTRRVADLALAEVKGALWRPGGRELVVSGRERRATPLRLWSVSAGSGGMRPLTSDVSDYTPVGWGGTTDEMLVIRLETLRSLWTAETSAPDHPRLVAQDAGGLYGFDAVAWGTQGELLYTLTESDNADLWGIQTATLRRRRLTTDPGRRLPALRLPRRRDGGLRLEPRWPPGPLGHGARRQPAAPPHHRRRRLLPRSLRTGRGSPSSVRGSRPRPGRCTASSSGRARWRRSPYPPRCVRRCPPTAASSLTTG